MTSPPYSKIHRTTTSICPVCHRTIDANVLEENGKIYFSKQCAADGIFKILLSDHPQDYFDLEKCYFESAPKYRIQKEYIFHITGRCNLDCPVCYSSKAKKYIPDMTLQEITKFLKNMKGYKISLMGAEPTLHNDLPEILKVIKRTGNTSAIYTNGIKLSDIDYLKGLVSSGLDEVHLQFDGFSDAVYKILRGRELLDTKLKTLYNLHMTNTATSLIVTLVQGLNETEIIKILDYASKHTFVKQLLILGCSHTASAENFSPEKCLMPDQVLDIIDSCTSGTISRREIIDFQKFFYAVASIMGRGKCFFVNPFILIRSKNCFIPLGRIINIEGCTDKLLDYIKARNRKNPFAILYLFFAMLKFFRLQGLLYPVEMLSLLSAFLHSTDLSKISSRTFLLTTMRICDPYSIDFDLTANCCKGYGISGQQLHGSLGCNPLLK